VHNVHVRGITETKHFLQRRKQGRISLYSSPVGGLKIDGIELSQADFTAIPAWVIFFIRFAV